MLYFLRTSTCFNQPALLEKYDKTVRDGLSKECYVNFDNDSSTQLASTASLLAIPAFLASVFVASDFLTRISSETFEDIMFTKAFEKRLKSTYEQESLLDGTQKNWTQPVYVKTAQDLISRIDGIPDVSAKDVSAKTWQGTYQQKKIC